MNKGVERPSRIIEVKTIKLQQVQQQKAAPSLDFYQLDNENFARPTKKYSAVSGVFDQILKDKDEAGNETQNINDLERKDMITTSPIISEFLISAIKNDIRVRNYEYHENFKITVCFCTVEDAISFYKQYFKIAIMAFKPVNDLNIISSPFIYDTVTQSNNDHLENHCTSNQTIDSISMCDSPKMVEENKPFVKISIEIKTQEDFDARVNYFSKMKNIYSKNEIKKISTFLENGHLDYILINIKELCVGSASNLIIQSLFKDLSTHNLCRIITAIGDDISAICSTKYGAYSIQSLIMACYTKETQELIVKCFGDQGKFLLCHEIGNYTIQRILLFDENYVYELFKNNLKSTIKHELGKKVFKRCLELLRNKSSEIKNDLRNLKTIVSYELKNEIDELIRL